VQDTSFGGVAIGYGSDGYVPDAGAGHFLPGIFEHHGAVQYMPAYDSGDGVVRNMAIKDGRMMVEDKPPSAWSRNDTSAGKYPLGTKDAWVPFDGADPLQITTLVDVADGDLLTFQMTVHATNADNKTATIAMSIGADGAEPTAAGVSRVLSKNFSGNLDLSLSQAAPSGGWPAGTVFRGYARKTVSNDGSPVADGTIKAHTMLVSSAASGGGSVTIKTPATDGGELATGTTDVPLTRSDRGESDRRWAFTVTAGADVLLQPLPGDIAAIINEEDATIMLWYKHGAAANTVDFTGGWDLITWAGQTKPDIPNASGDLFISITSSRTDTGTLEYIGSVA